MDVQFPLIYCSRHPHYQLNLICRHPTCSEKGALCCRCQLSRHNGNGHTFESFVPLDEILILSHEACEDQYIDMEQSAYEMIRKNREGALQLEIQMSAIQEIIHERIRDDFIAIGQLQQGYRDIGGLANQMLIPPETTPTDEGVSVKEVFLTSMIMIADKIIIKDGEFALDKSDLLDSINTIVKRKQSAIKQLDKVYKNANLQMLGLKQLLKMGCMLGIDQNLPMSLFIDWVQIYNGEYSHPTDISNITIPYDSIVCVGAMKGERLIMCAIDYGHTLNQLHSLTEIDSNGIHWYLEKGKSFGFSDVNSKLNGSDIFPGDQKLSWKLDGSGGFRAGNQLHLQESSDIHDTRDLVKVLRSEVAHYKQQMGVLSLSKDEVTFELNKLSRYVERMELQLREREGEIASLKQQKVEQEGYFQRQIEDLKVKAECDQQIFKKQSIDSHDETRSHSMGDVQKLQSEKQDYIQNIKELELKILQDGQMMDDMNLELENYRKELTKLTEELNHAQRVIASQKEQIVDYEAHIQNETIKYSIQIDDLKTQLDHRSRQF